MNWSYIVKAKNNIHNNCPPLMEDSTLFTDWDSASKSNDLLKKTSGIENNYDYRQWLIHNGNGVMKTNKIKAQNEAGVKYHNSFLSNTKKYIFTGCGDKTIPLGYESSDLKDIYLSKQQLQEKLSAPIMTQYDLLKNGLTNHF